MIEVELLGIFDPVTKRATPRFEALVKLPGQSQADRKLIKLVRHLSPKNATIDNVSDAQIDISNNPSGTVGNVPQVGAENLGNPCGMGAERLEALLAEVLAEASPPVFSEDFSLSKHSERVQLAKMVIAQNLGKEQTILLLWGIRPGGRNHIMYTEARKMLDRLIEGEY